MKQSYKGGGLKVLRAEVSLRDCFLVSGAGWALLIPKEKCPGEITGQLVAWLADMPRIGDGSWLVKGYAPQPMEAAEKAAGVQEHTAGGYTLGLKLLPLRTETDVLVQLGDKTVAALEQLAADVVSPGLNMGAFDPGARVARWQDEETEAQFWACNDIGSVPENARTAAEKFAGDSGSTLGKIRRANHGQFSISDRDGFTPYLKNVRVVTTVE